MSLKVDRFTGPDGLTMLLSWLSIGPPKGGGYAPRRTERPRRVR
jgi:hypothetical protein